MTDRVFPIRLEYDYFQLYVNWALPDGSFEKVHSKLLHKFQSGSEPDLLFDHLLNKANSQLVYRQQLIEDGVISNSRLDFTRVIMEQARFNPLLKKLFVEVLRPNKVQLKVKSTITELELHKLSAYLNNLKHSETARHKNAILFRLPEAP